MTPRERAEAKGHSLDELVTMTGVWAEAERRCRARELKGRIERIQPLVMRRLAMWQHLEAVRQSTDIADDPIVRYVAAPEPDNIDSDERAEAMATLDEIPDMEAHTGRIADGIMADLCIACDEEAWSRGYQWRYTDAMRERDFRALTRMAVRMGVVAMGPVDEDGTLANGTHYGADTTDDLVAISLGILWELLGKYEVNRHGRRQSPLKWVRTMFYRVLEQRRRDLHTDRQVHACDETVSIEETELAVSPSAEDEAAESLLRHGVRQALATLKQDHRDLAVLVLSEGLSIADASRRLGITEATGRQWMHRIKPRLQRLLADLEETL